MTVEELNKNIKRHQTLKEYSKAFDLCLVNIFNDDLRECAYEAGKKLIKEHGINVMKEDGSKRTLTVPLRLTLDWIVDTAISLGFKTMDRGTISMGLFSSCPCVTVGSLLAKQKYGVKENKDGTTTLVYTSGTFAGDYKLINALCSNIIDQLAQSNSSK